MVEQGSARVADARWSRPPQLQLVRYDITGHDRQGLFLSVSSKLAEMGIDAQAIKLTAGADALARGYARLELDDLSDREDIAYKLRSIPGITSVRIREPRSHDARVARPTQDEG
jgi:(p)ppGpp synthase/HD superfamily hydrolase